MQDNFDLKGYLRHGNKLLNEGIGGYMDLKPINELDGPMGMPDTDEDNPWMEEVDGTEAYTVGEWKCYYDHPGHLVWSYSDVPFSELAVYATPGFDGEDSTPIQTDMDNETVDTASLGKGTFASFEEYAAALKPYLDDIEREFAQGLGGVKEGEHEGDQYDGEYDGHTGPAIANEAFDFEDFDDTDLGGPGVEMTIDNIIADYDRIIKTNVPKEMQDSARIAVKKLWMEKIKNWRSQ